jgi:hypothetical protein
MKKLKVLLIIFSLLLNCAAGAFCATKQVVSAEIIFSGSDNIDVSHTQTTFVYNESFTVSGTITKNEAKTITDITARIIGRYNGETYTTTIFTPVSITVEDDGTFLSGNITLNTSEANVFYYIIEVNYKLDGTPYPDPYKTIEYTVTNPYIDYTPVTKINASDKFLFTQGEVAYVPLPSADYNVTNVVFEYKLDDSVESSTTSLRHSDYDSSPVTFENTSAFAVTADEKITYRIKARVGPAANARFKVSSWVVADIISEVDVITIDPATELPMISLPNGDSRYSGSSIIFKDITPSTGDVNFSELPSNDQKVTSSDAIKIYRLNSTTDIGTARLDLKLSYGQTVGKYEIRVMDSNDGWHTVESTTNDTLHTVSASNVKALADLPAEQLAISSLRNAPSGAFNYHFGVFPLSAPDSGKYLGPDRRIVIVTRTTINFRNPEGSTVKIFNTNGKKVKESSVANFVWDGRGVPSGTYIYQVKIKGDITSGTVAVAK